MKKESNNKSIIYTLPFYGVPGSISKIIAHPTGYYVVRYNIDGQERRKEPITTKKYEKLLQDNFYPNIKQYLESTKTTYTEYKNKPSKNLNIKVIHLTTTIAILVIIASFPMILSIMNGLTSIAYLGVITLATSLSGLCVALNLTKDYHKEQNRIQFIKEYENYQQQLINYYHVKPNTKTTKPTKYIGIGNQKAKENSLNLQKIKILEQTDNHHSATIQK